MYEGIDDMPQAVWRNIGKAEQNETLSGAQKQDAVLQLLYIQPKKVTKRNRNDLKQRLQDIKDQHFEEILLDDDLELKILKHVDLNLMRTELLIEHDGHKKTLYRALEMELEANEVGVDTSDKRYTKNKMILSKYMSYPINENLHSVREYDAMFKMLRNEYEALEAQRMQQRNN
jgi:hypothetical protein